MNATENEAQTYRIPEDNLPRLYTQIEKLNKRARKLGVAEISLEHLSEELTEIRDPNDPIDPLRVIGYRKWITLRVDGETPRLAGWAFLARLSHVEGGTLVLNVPGAEVPERFRTAEPLCEHCGTIRRRNDTFVLRHEDGTIKQVGRNCLADFLGHANPEMLARAAEWLISIHALAGALEEGDVDDYYRDNSPHYYHLGSYLTYVAACIIKNGWVSKGRARDTYETSTADEALSAMYPSSYLSLAQREDLPRPNEADDELAQAALDWAAGLTDEQVTNDYLHNLRVLASAGVVDSRGLGLGASTIVAYQKAMEREVQNRIRREQRGNSEHFGEVKKREVFTLTFTGWSEFEGNYGTTYVMRFVDATGNEAVWFASRAQQDMSVGSTYEVKATVKAHNVRNEIKQTILTRCKVGDKKAGEKDESRTD